MTIELDPEADDRDDIARKFGSTVGRESLRTSNSRRLRLQKGSQRRTREWDLRLDIDPSHQTAHVDQSGEGYPEVVVTGRELPQPVTNLPPEDWDYAAQRALGWHEDGHVLYTDHDDFMDRLNNLDTGDKGVAKQVWNALEDGAIELQLADRWGNAHAVLGALRSNLFVYRDDDDSGPGIHDVERGGQVFTLALAVVSVCMDRWMQEVYQIDQGVESKLLDPDDAEYHFATENDRALFMGNVLPEIDSVVPDVLSEPDPIDRNARIFEFIEEVLPDIDAADADGKSQMNKDEQEASGSGMPDDASEGHTGEARSDADALDDVDPEDVEDEDVTIVPGDGDGDPVDVRDVEIPEGIGERLSEEANVDRRSEAGLTDDLLDELEEICKSAADDDLKSDTIVVADEDWDASETRYQEAKRASGAIARILQNRLQRERHSEVQRNQRRGRFTGRGGATVRAQRGEREVKEIVSEPEEKDYHFMFVVDRSGSMSGIMGQAEEALGMLALALEDVGVEVSIIELYGNEARLAKPFGVPIEQRKERVFHGQTSGGTPLADAMKLARSRLLREGENSYMVAVTDGVPRDPDEFSRVIRESPMPVLGVNLGADGAGMSDYDRAVAATPGDTLAPVLMGLVNEVMF